MRALPLIAVAALLAVAPATAGANVASSKNHTKWDVDYGRVFISLVHTDKDVRRRIQGHTVLITCAGDGLRVRRFWPRGQRRMTVRRPLPPSLDVGKCAIRDTTGKALDHAFLGRLDNGPPGDPPIAP